MCGVGALLYRWFAGCFFDFWTVVKMVLKMSIAVPGKISFGEGKKGSVHWFLWIRLLIVLESNRRIIQVGKDLGERSGGQPPAESRVSAEFGAGLRASACWILTTCRDRDCAASVGSLLQCLASLTSFTVRLVFLVFRQKLLSYKLWPMFVLLPLLKYCLCCKQGKSNNETENLWCFIFRNSCCKWINMFM